MILVCMEEYANGNIHVQGKENGPRIHNGKGTNNNIYIISVILIALFQSYINLCNFHLYTFT